MKILVFTLLVVASLFLEMNNYAYANQNTYLQKIDNSVFAEVAKEHGIDPVLLYTIALVESSRKVPGTNNYVAPSRFTLNSNGNAYYFDSKEKAIAKLTELAKYTKNIDIGLMQINYRWHEDKVGNFLDLLDTKTNLRIGAQILSKALNSHKNPCIAIGHYHSWSNETAASKYGCKVLSIYKFLKHL